MTGPWEKFQPAPDQGDVAVADLADGPWTKFQASPITTEKQMLNRTAVAKTDDSPAPPETPGILTAVAAIPGGAARELGNQAMQASDVARGIPPRANLTGTPDEQALSQPIEYGWPTWAGIAKGVYQGGKALATSAPQWVGAVAGGLAGTAAGAELGPLAILTGAAGAASGAAMVSAVQEFGGLYREELDKTPNQPDAAFNNALKRSAISAAGSGASFGAFELAPAVGMLRGVFLGGKPVEKAATDAGWQVAENGRWVPPAQPVAKTLAQQAPIQTGIAAAENTAQNAEQGKPLGEGLEQTIGAGALGVAVPMAAHAAIQHIAGLTAPMAPKALKGALDDIEQPPAPPGTPQTPEQIAEAELQQGEPESTASDAGSTPGAAQSTSMPDESTPKSPGQQAIENVRAGRPATEGLPRAGEQQPEPPKGQWREVPQGQTPPADQMLFRHPDGRTFTFDPVAAEPVAEQPPTEPTPAPPDVAPRAPLVAGTYARPTPEERGARQAASLTPSPDAPVLPPAPAAPPTAKNPIPGNIESLDPMQIGVDADRFQFKGGGDERGVTDRLQGETQWYPIQAGVALVWRDPQGRDWVADGHQRVGLAQRLTQDGQDGIRVNAMILDSASGITDSDARALAAYRNIGEGSGSPIDAAKVIRESAAAGREVPQLPPRSALARDGAALARLGDQAFGMAINEVVPTNQAAVVGRLVSDPAQQVEALRLLAQAKPDNARQVDLIVRDMLNSGTETLTQDSLFGAEAFASSVVLERAEIADEAMNVVKRDRALFRTLVENAERIESQGKNTLDSAGNTQRLSTDEQAAAAVSQLATHHGPVSDALTAIARRYKNGEITRAAAGREFAEIVRSSIEGGEGQGGVPDNDRARNAPPRDEAAAPVAEPPIPEAPTEPLEGPDQPGLERIGPAELSTDPNTKQAVLRFEAKPHQDILTALKADGWRWSSPLKAWTRKGGEESADSARRVLGDGSQPARPEAAPPESPRSTAPAKLRAVAEKLEAEATEAENRDRQTNTAKRAREAAGATERARGELQLAATMKNLADAIERGEAGRLSGVTSRAGVEALDLELRRSRYARWRRENTSHMDTERQKDAPFTEADIQNAQLPQVSLHPAWTKDLIEELKRTVPKGTARLQKWLDGRANTDGRLIYPGSEQVDAFREAIAAAKKKGKLPSALARVAENIAEVDRFTRMGIKGNDDLHAALREYLQFRGGRKQEDPIAKMERDLVGTSPGVDFFPTPKELTDRVIHAADIKPGMRVLEPSAGKGDLADAARAAGAKVDTVELSNTLQNLLRAKGHEVVGGDFGSFHPIEQYDRVVMNPPFSNRLDAQHVQRAYGMLKPGGRLVAITGEGVHFGTDKAAQAFRDWLEEHDAKVEKLPSGSFKSSFRPTGVETRMVVIDKPDQQAMFSKRSGEDAPAADLDHLAGRMVQVMAHLGMPDGAALHLVDQIDNRGANASYARNVIEFAMDTRPERFGGVLFHEVMHGLMDPANKLLTPTEVLALKAGAQRWLKQGDNLARLKRMYGEDQKVLGEEAVAHLAEEVLARARQPSSLIERVIDRIKNFIQGVRQVFQGEGYKTSDDVFRSILNGEVARRGAVGEPGAASGEQQSRRDPLPPKAGPDLFGATKKEPEKRQPEFTVRNDPSQGSLFGGPSAVQAQASRDAQGRGALLPDQRQKPADEGLFARPEPVQPELAPRIEKPKIGNMADDFARFAEGRTDPHAAAADYVIQRGKSTGFEHLTAVDPLARTVVVAHTDSDRSAVGFPPEFERAIDDPAGRIVSHHNHPRDTAPSVEDLTSLGRAGHKVLMVHGSKGSIHIVTLGGAGRYVPYENEQLSKWLHLQGVRAWGSVDRALQKAVNEGRIPVSTANGIHAGLIVRAMHEAHLLDYYTTAAIPSAHAKLADEVLRKAVGDLKGSSDAVERLYRPPFNLRTEGGLGPILRGSEELAQGRPWPENGAGGGQARGSLPAVAGTDLKPQGKLFSRRSEDEETGLPHLYSGVARATRELKQAKGSGEQMLAMLSRSPGVKPEELQWLGVADWLKGQKSVTKDQIADFIRANALKLDENIKGAPGLDWVEQRGPGGVRILTQGIGQERVGRRAPRARVEVHPDGSIFAQDRTGYLREFANLDDAKEFASDDVTASENPTRYSGYLQPFTAGPTYREMLLKLPPKESAKLTAARAAKNKAYAEFEQVRDREGVGSWATVDAQKAWLAADKVLRRLEREAANDSSVYKSSHWNEPNVLAHVRLEERAAPDGKRVLMVHEVQSDWHQAGRKQGYQGNIAKLPDGFSVRQRDDGRYEVVNEGRDLPASEPQATPDAAVAQALKWESSGVPDAPFKTSWPQLAMKRVIAHAAEHGFDRVAWSPGEVHADRYSLARRIARLELADNSSGSGVIRPKMDGPFERGHLRATDPNGRAVFSQWVEAKDLPGLVGQEIADKLVGAPTRAVDGTRHRELAGLDLKTGGEGMKGFYDKILPAETQKLVGKYGAKVGRGEVHGDRLSFDQTAPDAQAQADHAQEWRRLQQQLDVLHQRQMRGNWDERNAAIHDAQPIETAINDLHAQMVRETRERRAQPHPVHQFDVTPELRRQVLDEGLPLFSKRDAQLDYDVPKGGPEILRDMKGVTKAVGEVRAALAPTDLRGAKPMEQLARAHGGMKARAFDRAQAALEDGRKYLERMPQADQLMFTHRMETGEQQATPELTAIAGTLRNVIDGWTKKVQGLGRGYLANAIEDYMGHIWGNYADWSQGKPTTLTPQQMQVQALAKMHGKRPLQGGASFLKQRTFPTQMDGIAAGLIPSTFNPIDLQLMKLREMQKFFYGTTLADQMKQSHLARWVPSGHEQDAENGGMVRLDDRVFQPRMYVEGVPGKVEPGNWYAAEPVARVFNNYMSGGFYGKSVIYDAFRGLGNAMNSLQLSFSGFHATFVALDTMMSKMALGLQQIAGGRPLAGLTNIALSPTPFSVISTVRAGEKLRQAWINPGDATPEFQKIANLYAQAGGRAKMDMFYRSSASGPFFRSLSDLKNPGSIFADAAGMFRDAQGPLDKAVLTPLRVAARLIDTLNEPLMGQLVPRAKMGVFADLAKDWLARHPDATPEEQRAAAIKMQDSIDNRMGQMVYDNVFWKKAQKDIAFIAFRSVGWNVGTVREIGGAGVDGLQAVRNMLAGKAPELTTRMAYTIAMPVVTAVIGAAMTYLATGQGPTQMLDYFFPPTGNTKDGITERRIIPGYIKDVIEYSKAPVQTVLNKTHPLISTLSELHQNRDYYGGIIYDRERDNPAVAYGSYLLNQNLPFSWRGQQKLQQSGASRFDQSMAFWGFGPAPQAIVNPEKGDAWQARQDAAAYKRREREPNRVSLQ